MRGKTRLMLAAAGSAGAVLAVGALATDRTAALLAEGYEFIPNRCRRYGTDVFETRLALERAVCITGEEAARVFYEPGRFTRMGSLPQTTLRLLQDKGSVQLLDDEAHRRRKGMFLSVLGPDDAVCLADAMERHLAARLGDWETLGRVVLHDEVEGILCRAACEWAGVPLAEPEAERRTREFSAMIEGAGSVGPRNWRGLTLRRRTERWARAVVRGVRAGEVPVPEGSALHVVAWHRGLDGELLGEDVAAVELINVLRPTVAVARYVTFAALALHEHPMSREEALAGGDESLLWFVQEVRRFYPFFPFVGGRTREGFEWRGRRFAEGEWVLLDTSTAPTTTPGRRETRRSSGPGGSGIGTGAPSTSSPREAATTTPDTAARGSGSR